MKDFIILNILFLTKQSILVNPKITLYWNFLLLIISTFETCPDSEQFIFKISKYFARQNVHPCITLAVIQCKLRLKNYFSNSVEFTHPLAQVSFTKQDIKQQKMVCPGFQLPGLQLLLYFNKIFMLLQK